jgi:hypothetical protein
MDAPLIVTQQYASHNQQCGMKVTFNQPQIYPSRVTTTNC